MQEIELDVLARTIWAEARGEGMAGQVAVGWAIRNRVEADLGKDGKADWWGEGYVGVCKAPWQFSCWNKNDPNRAYLDGAKPIPPTEYARAREAAVIVISAKQADPTCGATHYYARTMKTPPKWTDYPAIRTTKIGRHVFFRNVP
jgi:N-acetylmuramoyl-L-alanine amidase